SATTTRAPMTRAVNETAIQTVDVLSFKADASEPMNIKKGTFFYRAQGTYTETFPGQGRVEVRLTGSAEAQTLVVLANVRAQVNALGAAYGEEKEAVMKRLLVNATADGQPDLANGMPMWGELPNKAVGEGFSPSSAPEEVTMIRSVAKLTLKCSDASGKNFFEKFEALRLYNYRGKGRVSPDNCMAPNAPGMTVDRPTVPDNATMAQGTFKELYGFSDPTVFAGQESSFYLFEADNRAKVSESGLRATCLLVFVKFNTNTPEGMALINNFSPHFGYYRIDFKDYATGDYLDLLRNYRYVIETESVDTPPAATPEEALNGRHSLKCKIVPWNEVEEDVKVPAVKRLTVDTRSIRLIGASAATTGKTLTVTTENTGGWTVTDVPSWLTVSPMSGTADGTGSITVKSNDSSAFSTNAGSFKLKAGNAEMAINVILGKLPLEYVAEFDLAGGAQYGTKPSDASPTSAQTDADLRWATSHDNDQSGYYNWYVCTGTYDATYNPSTKNLFSDGFFTPGHPGHGYHLPSRQEFMGVFSYSGQVNYGNSVNYSNINEACEFGSVKRTFGADYTSTGNGTCYALRFKQATGAPIGGSSLGDFPLATDNSMLCAYRYRRVGSLSYNGNNTDRLEVDCVYLGEASASMPITTISDDSWWSAQAVIPGNVVTRVFPATGHILYAHVSGSGSLNYRGVNSFFWLNSDASSFLTWHVYFDSNQAKVYFWSNKYYGYSVRLFSSK
ncbi:BACON domain-containing protein, partial [Bacteroides sp. KG156]